jgi:uncharacterized protein (DUF2235 family)
MPRKIILLSDGTGNSSANFWRTNVWRMFCALDLTSSDQVACYDDGVGTSSFKPWAILGGAFGFGLRRNVISLYKFACRNFRAPGDQIFGFGFSRGAFTIRVVIGLIIDQGLVPAADRSEAELNDLAVRAYRDYHRRYFHTNWGLILKRIRRWRGKEITPPSGPPAGHNIPLVRFLGLWDTVAAYGLPVEEMTRGVSQWLWPLEIPTHTLHPSVRRACHALSLDDERTTFHPVLWNEKGEPTQAPVPRFTNGERLSQVWFAGVHANVGGGYPDDSLAQIPLYWIMQEAQSCGLVFKAANPAAIAETKEAQDKDGRLYDSRRGFQSYYRYGPRRLSQLCNELFSRTLNDEVSIARPKIHESVFKRIQNNAHVYAPIGIPHEYEVVVTVPRPNGVDADFRIDALPTVSGPSTYELSQDAQARVVDERAAIWPLVYLRAGLYLLTLVATLLFLVFPFTGRSNDIEARQNTLGAVSNFIRWIDGFLPGWLTWWLEGYAQYPLMFLVLAAIIGLLGISSSRVAAMITDRMRTLWQDSLAHRKSTPKTAPTDTPGWKERLFLRLRSGWRDYIGPALSAILIVYVGLSLAGRLTFAFFDETGLGLVCTDTKKDHTDIPDIPDEGVLFSFNVANPCFATGYKVKRLKKYLVWTTPIKTKLDEHYKPYHDDQQERGACTATAEFRDGSVKADARGYGMYRDSNDEFLSIEATLWRALLLPLRRHYAEPWFQPVARYGAIGGEFEFLEPDPDPDVKDISEIVRPKVDGELFLYVNDAVLPIPGVQPFYWDNKGCMTFFIKPR